MLVGIDYVKVANGGRGAEVRAKGRVPWVSGAPLAIGAGGARGGGEVTFAACWCVDRITPGIQHVGATRW